MRRTVAALVATMAAGALGVSATTAIAVALAAQQPAVQQPAAQPVAQQPAAKQPVAFEAQVALPALLPAGLRAGPDEPAASRGGAPSAHDSLPSIGPALRASIPVAIEVPAIGVGSSLHEVGMTAAGALEVPSGSRYDEAAWYGRSVTPGARGPAVILGHVDSAARGPSVFYKLGELQQGDDVHVTRADGSVAVFTVDGVRSYAKDEFPTRLVYGDTPHAALRLITCGGTFDRSTGHYVDNVVVFASLAGSRSPTTPVRPV